MLRHRLILENGITPDEVLTNALELVPMPTPRAYAFV